MKYPIKEKDIIEFGLGESGLNAYCFEFGKFFNLDFESIEYFRMNHQTQQEFLGKKILYDASGFINKIENYNAKGERSSITHFEKTKSEIISKRQLDDGYAEQVWKFNQSGNLIEIQSEESDNYYFHFDENEMLVSVSEGLKFKWENGHISQLINLVDNSVIQKVIKRDKFETKIEFVGSANKSVPAITTYKYDDLGRLIKIEYLKKITEIKYETSNQSKSQISTSYFDNEQTGFFGIIEKQISNDKIEVEQLFQQRKSSPIHKSRLIKNKRR